MKKIVSVLQPFALTQDLIVYEDGNKLEIVPTTIEELNATVLKVAHHGSKSSSTEEFLKLVNPKVALIGVGESNNFGHPSSEVVDRLNVLRC